MKVNLDPNLYKMVISQNGNTKSENKELLDIYHSTNGDYTIEEKLLAREKLILGNLKMVIHLICSKHNSITIDHNDVFMVGIIGLIKAIDKFNVKTKNALSTYAYIWIKKEINRMLTKDSRLIRHPISITETIIPHLIKEYLYDNVDNETIDLIIEKIKEKYPRFVKVKNDLIKSYAFYNIICIDSLVYESIEDKNINYKSNMEMAFIDLVKERFTEDSSQIVKHLDILRMEEKPINDFNKANNSHSSIFNDENNENN